MSDQVSQAFTTPGEFFPRIGSVGKVFSRMIAFLAASWSLLFIVL